MKKGWLILLCLVLGFTAVAVSAPIKVVLVTDIGGLGDKAFNDGCWLGVQKAVKDFGVKAKVIQSYEQEDYVPNITNAAEHGDVVMAAGFLMTDAMAKVAPMYPKKYFIIVDTVVKAPNVASFLFKEQEGAFLAGMLAAAVTKKGIVGYVGGMKIPPVIRFAVGYEAGVRTYCAITGKKVKVIGSYTGTFNDAAKGKAAAMSLFGQGADIVFHIAGQTGLGVIEAAKEKGEGYFAIGVDLNQDAIAPGRVLTSVLKRVDVAAYLGIKMVVEGKFKGGIYELGLKENGVGLTDMKYTRKYIPKKVLALIEKAKKAIIEGKLVVPSNEDELKKFKPPKSL